MLLSKWGWTSRVQKPVRTHALPPTVKLVGDSIIYFTICYTTLNYLYYRSLNKDIQNFYSIQDEPQEPNHIISKSSDEESE